MIKIRYSALPPGLYARADVVGRHIVVYLLPGLTLQQRRAALLRIRSSGRMGHGPMLSSTGLARAIVADRIWVTLRNGASAVRSHPVLLVTPVMLLVSAALAYIVLSPVSFGYRPGTADPGPRSGPSMSDPGKRAADPPRWPHPVIVVTPVDSAAPDHGQDQAGHQGQDPGHPRDPGQREGWHPDQSRGPVLDHVWGHDGSQGPAWGGGWWPGRPGQAGWAGHPLLPGQRHHGHRHRLPS